MSSSDRRVFLIGLLAVLAGCGFTPAGTPGAPVEALRGSIDYANPATVDSFVLVRQLERRLGDTSAPQYALSTQIRVRDQGVGILPDQTITRYNVIGIIDYQLAQIGNGAQLTQGTVSNFTSYSATSTTLATTSAQRDARERLMITLADQIATELIQGYEDWSP